MKNNNEIKLIDVLESYLGEKIMNYSIEFKDNNRIDIKVRPVRKVEFINLEIGFSNNN